MFYISRLLSIIISGVSILLLSSFLMVLLPVTQKVKGNFWLKFFLLVHSNEIVFKNVVTRQSQKACECFLITTPFPAIQRTRYFYLILNIWSFKEIQDDFPLKFPPRRRILCILMRTFEQHSFIFLYVSDILVPIYEGI